MHHLRSLFVCLLVFVTLPLGANAQLRRDIRRWKPLAQTPFSLWNSEIELKIKEGYAISVRGEAILDARGKVILSLKNELKGLPFIASRQAFGLDLQAVRALVKRARSRCRCNVADLSLYVTFKTSATEAQRYALLERLNDHPAVEIAYPKSRPVRPPVDIPPTTPDYSGNQDYFGAAPSGIAVDAVRSMPGGHGEGIHVVDVEFNFHADHEDLETCKNAVIPGATGLYSDPEYVYHGTSVLGILFGGDNGYGVTGSLTKGVCHFSPDYSDYWGYDVARGITSGALAVDAPAIFLLEAQEGGPNYDPNTGAGLIPSEWLPGVFDAISAVVAAGYVVVEAAGNGWEDLDDPVYADAFNREVNDSGAIIVGAGTPPVSDGTGRKREYFSCYGSRLDVHGWGSYVYTAGYGDLFNGGGDVNQYYTAVFAGTSSASPIVVSAVGLLLGVLRARGYDHPCVDENDCDSGYICDAVNFSSPRCIGGQTMSSFAMRQLLTDTGSPQLGDTSERIGPLPNLEEAVQGLSTCGDSVVEGLEMCDDGNMVSGDGCSSDCRSDETCGNGYTDVNEMCDDGNTVSGDGCSSDCLSDETCGNGFVDSNEMCDDGNTVSGDGCSSDCRSDETCGNGVVDPGEVCDDGNTVSGDGCAQFCTSDETCGNSIVDVNEDCDDGNTLDGDECPSTCRTKAKDDGCSCKNAGTTATMPPSMLMLLLVLLPLVLRRRWSRP